MLIGRTEFTSKDKHEYFKVHMEISGVDYLWTVIKHEYFCKGMSDDHVSYEVFIDDYDMIDKPELSEGVVVTAKRMILEKLFE